MNNKSSNWKSGFLLSWIINNLVGFSFGAVIGEFIGHLVEKQLGWQAGLLTAGIIFEASIWIMRSLTIKDAKGFRLFRTDDILIWLSAEGIGLLLAEGVYTVTSTFIMVIGPMVGSALGAFILILFWIIRIPSQRKRFWAIQSILYGVVGMFALSFGLSMSFVFIEEISKNFSRVLDQYWGLGVFSLLTGAFIGVLTGIAYIKLNVVRSFDTYDT